MSKNSGNLTNREKSNRDRRRVKKLKKPPDINKQYGFIDNHWRMESYCKTKAIRDKKVKALRLQYPERSYTNIDPK